MSPSIPPTQLLDVREGRLAYDQRGEGPLLVCLPGMGDLRQSYRFLAPLLAAAGYRVATMDLRGLGESSSEWPSYSEQAVGDDLLQLVRHLGGPAVVVAHSFSPGAAIYAAAQSPNDVSATVLLAPWAHAPTLRGIKWRIARWVMGSPMLWGAFYKSLYPGPKPADFRAYLRRLRRNLREPGRAAALIRMGQADAKDARNARDEMKQPALIVMGARDPDFADPEAEAEAMRGSLTATNAEMAMVPRAGHYPHAQFPEQTASAILAFLQEVGHLPT